MKEIVIYFAILIILAICAMIGRYLIPLLKKKVEESDYKDFINWTIDAVRMAEQTIKGAGMGTAKKEYVVDFLTQLAIDNGYSFTHQQIDTLIESAVFMLKGGK